MSKITQRQLFFLIAQIQIGIGFLSLPFDLQKVTDGDGWISVLFAGIVIQILISVIFALLKRFPSLNIYEISISLLGGFVGRIINIFYISFFISTQTIILILYHKIIKNWIAPRTPDWILLALVATVSIYLTRENLRIITRFFIIAFFPFFIILFLSIYSFKDINILYIMPIGSSGILRIIEATEEAVISMLGFEIILVVSPFVLGKKKTQIKTLSLVNLFITLFYTLNVFLCLTFFSPIEIKLIPEPILYMIKVQSFKIIDRTDLIFLSIWIIFITTSYMAYLYVSSVGAAALFNIKSHRKVVPYIASLSFITAIFFNGTTAIKIFSKYITIGSYITIAFIPFSFLLISLLKKAGVNNR